MNTAQLALFAVAGGVAIGTVAYLMIDAGQRVTNWLINW